MVRLALPGAMRSITEVAAGPLREPPLCALLRAPFDRTRRVPGWPPGTPWLTPWRHTQTHPSKTTPKPTSSWSSSARPMHSERKEGWRDGETSRRGNAGAKGAERRHKRPKRSAGAAKRWLIREGTDSTSVVEVAELPKTSQGAGRRPARSPQAIDRQQRLLGSLPSRERNCQRRTPLCPPV